MIHDTALDIDNFLGILREKWNEVPGGDINRIDTSIVSQISNNELYEKWLKAHKKATQGDYFNVRGWYQTLYKEFLSGKKMLDVGSGFGIDGIYFAQQGAHITFLDIVDSNLITISKICKQLKLNNVDFIYLNTIDTLDNLQQVFDVIWCQGSLLNAPFDIIQKEREALVRLLSVGGRWIELSYPKSRWIREGKLPFEQWGAKTDGGAPWIEWYDLEKLQRSLEPAVFDVVLSHEFYHNDFIWFDLIRRK